MCEPFFKVPKQLKLVVEKPGDTIYETFHPFTEYKTNFFSSFLDFWLKSWGFRKFETFIIGGSLKRKLRAKYPPRDAT